MQIIFHIDLNAFYASAEIAMDPSLEGKPLVISGNNRRAIVSTASYEARKFGIHSAMPLFQAKQLCENLIIKPVNFDLYRRLSSQFFELISTYSPLLEIASIDECYVDFSNYIIEHNIHPYKLAKIIQEDVLNSLKLKCSIGIAPNKFMAKMASDMKKPMGITILNKSNYKQLLWPLDVSDMFGIGKKTAPKLKEMGILTIKDVANYDNYNKLRQVIGKNALLLYRKANGIDISKVNTEKNELKSVGNSTTLQYDTSDIDTIYETLRSLCSRVSFRAKKRNLIGNSVSITIKYSRFESVTRQTPLIDYSNEYEVILSTAKYLFDNNYSGKPLRLIGVSLNNVINQNNYKKQVSLFEQNIKEDKLKKTEAVINKINSENKYHLTTASALLNKSKNKYGKE